MLLFSAMLANDKAMRKGVTVVNIDGVQPSLPRPARYAGDDGGAVGDGGRRINPAMKQRTDDAFMHKLIAHR